MANLAISGLASGFDWQSTVTQLANAERQAQRPLENRLTNLDGKRSALAKLKAEMETLKGAYNTLQKSTDTYYGRTVSTIKTGEEATMSAVASGTTPIGSFVFDITRMATATQYNGGKAGGTAGTTSSTLASLKIANTITAGNFTVNGKTVTIATTDTLQAVFDKISTATGGEITATLEDDKIKLTANDLGSGRPRIVVGSGTDTSNFLTAMKLYSDTSTTPAATVSSSSAIGATNVNVVLTTALNTGSLTGLTDGKGTIKVNGKEISYDINKDSLRSIMSNINNSGAGVTVNYDPGADKFSMVNNDTGSAGITLEDSTGLFTQMGLTAAKGATLTLGVNAQFSINGGATITASSNKLTEADHGIPGLTVTATKLGSDTITTAADTSTARTNINAFITAYNKLNNTINGFSKITVNPDASVSVGTLAQNLEVSAWQRQLRSIAFGSVDTGETTISKLDSLGITISGSEGTMAITDQTKFDNALKDHPIEVAKIFNDSEDGIAKKAYDYIEDIFEAGGNYQSQIDSLNNQYKTTQDQILKMEAQIGRNSAALTLSFQRMETAQSQINRNLQILQSTFR